MRVIPSEKHLLFEVGQEEQETASSGYDSHAELVDAHDSADCDGNHSSGDSVAAVVKHHPERRRRPDFPGLFSVTVVADLVKTRLLSRLG